MVAAEGLKVTCREAQLSARRQQASCSKDQAAAAEEDEWPSHAR